MNLLITSRFKDGQTEYRQVNPIWAKFMRGGLDSENTSVDYVVRRQQVLEIYNGRIIDLEFDSYVEFETPEDMMAFILDWS